MIDGLMEGMREVLAILAITLEQNKFDKMMALIQK
jgi:hypothetical protein